MSTVTLPTIGDTKPSVIAIRSGDPVIVGWFDDALVPKPHALTDFFKQLGKLIALRRLMHAETSSATPGIEQAYRRWVSAYMDQIVSGQADDYHTYTLARDGGGRSAERVVSALVLSAKRLDKIGERMFRGQLAPDLYLGPSDHLSLRMDQFMAYMATNEIIAEDKPGGFRDYFAATYTGSDGQPVELPTSGLPNVLDEWINSNSVT